VGAEAGPKKMEKIAQLKLKTLTEDEYLALIGSRGYVLLMHILAYSTIV